MNSTCALTQNLQRCLAKSIEHHPTKLANLSRTCHHTRRLIISDSGWKHEEEVSVQTQRRSRTTLDVVQQATGQAQA